MTLMILGEAWGREEEQLREPFVGAAGRMLKSSLSAVGIRYDECYTTLVFHLRPQPTNDIKNLCGPKSEGIPGLPALVSGKYVRAEYSSELTRLYDELTKVKPTMILALGGTACWALGLGSSIKKIRGAPTMTKWGKVFPTIHPASIFRDWSQRVVFHADLEKVAREKEFPEIRRPQREIWVEPTMEDLHEFEARFITNCSKLSVDIETSGDEITCIGFAPSIDRALVVPFVLEDRSRYWKTRDEEVAAWQWVKRVCESHPHIVGQNFLYDMHRLWRSYGIATPGLQDDTMLLHHALYPELEKGLGFLGSVYTNEARWKFMRTADTLKKEDE